MPTPDIIITAAGESVSVGCPYTPDFPPAARKLGGRWDKPTAAWIFPRRNRSRVEDLLAEIYGWATEPGPMVVVSLTANLERGIREYGHAIYIAGRMVARATHRDSGAQLGDRVTLVQGDAGSGGSRKNWCTTLDAGSIVEIELPRSAAAKVVRYVEQTADNRWSDWIAAEILEGADGVDTTALESERARLLDRVAEIDKLLAGAA